MNASSDYTSAPLEILHDFYQIYLDVKPNEHDKINKLDKKYDEWVAQDKRRIKGIIWYSADYVTENLEAYMESLAEDYGHLKVDLVLESLTALDIKEIIEYICNLYTDFSEDWENIVDQFLIERLENPYRLAADYLNLKKED